MKAIDWDLHVHTIISSCGKEGASVENILEAAEKLGLKTIGFSDHCWAREIPGASPWHKPQDVEHVLKIKEMLPKDTRGIRILVGCETECIGNSVVGLNRELAENFDFVWLPANHFHQRGFVVPPNLGEGGPKAVSELLYSRFLEAVDLGFGSGIVHPFIPLGFLDWEEDILGGISDAQYETCFRAAASAGLAIEINGYTAENKTRLAENGFSSLYLNMHSIARECGCKFFFGSDAHHPSEMKGYQAMANFAEACGIGESNFLVV